jgi:hypothetical protein
MGPKILQLETPNYLAEDPRRKLVERIVASPRFARSDRLCSFLIHICEMSLQGRADEINEINIGAKLFGRTDYDPSVDGIVRSHASRLRQRLEQYFNEEGLQEPIRLFIPKGAYVPVFEPYPSARISMEVAPEESLSSEAGSTQIRDTPSKELPPKQVLLWPLVSALALACAVIAYLLIHPHEEDLQQVSSIPHPLWASFFAPNRPTMVVCADASLAILQDITEHNVNLPEYLNSDYRIHITPPIGATVDLVKDLAARRYTSVVDVVILTRLYRLPGIHPDRIQVRYSRDVRPDDLKDGSAILLGTQEGNPWVGIFENHMNFAFRDDLHRRIFSVINRSPRADELPRYDYDQADRSHKVYGVAALRPNLSASGLVLILEGTSMAGTEAAADFVFDDALLLPFLKKIQSPNGSLPYFEVLLQSNNMNGNASQLKIIGYRTSSD